MLRALAEMPIAGSHLACSHIPIASWQCCTHHQGQHAPTPLENGNILIFDNGVHRLDDPLPFSRVIEVNPATNEIVWTYQD